MLDDKTHHDKKEKFIFLVTTIYTLSYVVVSIIISLITKSITLAIDCAYGILDLFLLLFSMMILEKFKKNDRKFYNFGCFKLEPLSVFVQAILVLSVCVLGIITSLQNITYPAQGIKSYPLAIGFSTISFLSILILWIWSIRCSKNLKSPMIEANMVSFKVECIISGGMMIGFPLELWMYKQNMPFYIYIDSIMALSLCLYLIKEPIVLLNNAVNDLLDISPGPEVEQAILNELNQFLKEQYQLTGNSTIKIRKSGRKSFAIIYYEVKETLTFEAIQIINNSLKIHLETHFPEMDGVYCPCLGTAF
ncbi:MAG: cation transporter [Chlamydiota bacterium]